MGENPIYLILENGMVFQGKNFGACHDVTGEVVFTTSMTGYLETLTDPSYYGQIVLQTFPLIGNYGVIPEDFESASPKLSAYIVRHWCQQPSNFRNEGSLDAFLNASGVTGIYGIDTRRLTKIIREKGVMNARVSRTLPSDLSALATQLKEFRIQDAVASVGNDGKKCFRPENARRRVVLWDFGAKQGIVRALAERGCEVITMPFSSTAEDILTLRPDGVMLSNGPGDPAENKQVIRELAKLCGAGIPMFGICLGHQLLALAQGASTGKLHYGHRGANQPVKELETGRVFITSQNHGYAVEAASLPDCARESFVNANDGTNEGIVYTNMPAFSVQFHPEACGGPHDTMPLFDRFVQMMDTVREKGDALCR